MVTRRKFWSDDMARGGVPGSVTIVYAGDGLKEQAALGAGYRVDVWVDDEPGTIQPMRVLPDAEL